MPNVSFLRQKVAAGKSVLNYVALAMENVAQWRALYVQGFKLTILRSLNRTYTRLQCMIDTALVEISA
jgi:hypothetical protein